MAVHMGLIEVAAGHRRVQQRFGRPFAQQLQYAVELPQLAHRLGGQAHLLPQQPVEIPLTAAGGLSKSGNTYLATVHIDQMQTLAKNGLALISAAAPGGQYTAENSVALSKIAAAAQHLLKRIKTFLFGYGGVAFAFGIKPEIRSRYLQYRW